MRNLGTKWHTLSFLRQTLASTKSFVSVAEIPGNSLSLEEDGEDIVNQLNRLCGNEVAKVE
jgi:hypothetical protein